METRSEFIALPDERDLAEIANPKPLVDYETLNEVIQLLIEEVIEVFMRGRAYRQVRKNVLADSIKSVRGMAWPPSFWAILTAVGLRM